LDLCLSKKARAFGVSFCLGIAVGACGTPPPLQELDRVKAIEQILWEKGAMEFAPSRFDHFQGELKNLSLAYSREQAKWPPIRRGNDRLRQELKGLSSNGDLLLQTVLQSQEAAHERASVQVNAVRDDIARIRRFSSKVHLSRPARKKAVRAELLFSEAQNHLKAERYTAALEGAQAAVPLVSPAKEEMTSLFNRYRSHDNIARWEEWIRDTLEWSRQHNAPVIIVRKAEKTLTLYLGNRPIKVLPISLGFNGLNDKQRAGDGATPEGMYRVVMKKGKGESKFHKALLINYPNRRDRLRLKQVKEPGGLIEIHGGRDAGLEETRGCVALFNREIDDLFDRVAVGTPVTIVGTSSESLSLESLL